MQTKTDVSKLQVRWLGLADYRETFAAMRSYTSERGTKSLDQIWILEHPPVFTQGQAGKAEHLLAPGEIPVVQSDRGGQVTYHGPGQLVMYLLIDLKRKNIGIKKLVCQIEKSVIDTLQDYAILAHTRDNAPGVYVDGAKVCQLGLRVRKGCSYHGLSFNIDMDLSPFKRIHPCGFTDLEVVDLATLGGPTSLCQVAEQLLKHLSSRLEFEMCANSLRRTPDVQAGAN